jgi:chromosome segregation protein
MNALEDLVGIKEYDQKKADAKVNLNEAERKIEIASARIEEIKKQVNELEKQRNDAILFNLLNEEENKLSAHRLTVQINGLEEKLSGIENQIKEKNKEIISLEEERGKFKAEKNKAQHRLDKFNREAAERGNTRLPLLRSDLVGKNTLKESQETRQREIYQRKIHLEKTIHEKEAEIENSRKEVASRNTRLQQKAEEEVQFSSELAEKRIVQVELNYKILSARETAKQNQLRQEELTESLVPMQESLIGIETDIHKHVMTRDSEDEKISNLHERREQYMERRASLQASIKQYEGLKVDEARKLEDMIQTVEGQVQHQRSIRNTIEKANQLAKQAETTITELAAKRDLWKNIVTEEKALERIREIGEAGAMDGYHGSFRSLIRIDLQNQRAVNSSSNGWINAVVIDDYKTAKEHIERLKKTKLGMTRFIPLDQLREPEPLPDLEFEGVIGAIPELIRYDKMYAPAVYLLWGDTYLVEDSEAAELVLAQGYRAVTKTGDVFETNGGILGGYYRRPPDFTKLIPSEESISNLTTTIRDLRGKLKSRMKELRSSGFDLRKFTQYMEDSQTRVARIDKDIKATEESIARLDRNLQTLLENIEKAKNDIDNEDRLRIILEERKLKILEQIDSTKQEIKRLKEYKLSDVANLELERNKINQEIEFLENKINELTNDRTIESGFVNRILNLQITEAIQDIEITRQEISELIHEYRNIDAQKKEISKDITELEGVLGEVTSEVEATSRIFEQHQRTLRQYDRQLDQIARRVTEDERRKGQFSLEKERIRLQVEQKLEELARIGFSDKIEIEEILSEQVERRLNKIKHEKRGLGAINQLAIDHYHITMWEYKQRSIRINSMEDEKKSILNFMEEIEREKQEHFMFAYNQICENFSAIFNKLTGGGDGRLELQRPEDPFGGGVDLYIQFPGKPMRLASGASGGERSVAAIAYLLAIQRFLKAPFYLFDEIDAHLDDLNTSRLSEVLKENAADSQFLMVSLKDIMVYNADRIYGVFAQNGRSRVLVLPMKGAKIAA